MDLKDCRREIDDIDDRILELLNRRADLAMRIGEIKKAQKQKLYVPSRERAIFERLMRHNSGPFPADAIQRVFREIISASLSLEHPIRTVYLGPRATFTHAAALEKFGQSAQLAPVRTIASVFEEVETGRAQFGVVPIENSNEGAVTHTLDRFLSSEVHIFAEHYLEVSHDLLSKSGELERIERIYSHPQAIEQCRVWLEEHFPHAQIIEVSSTAQAAQMVGEEHDAAAIASKHAANLYALRTAAARIETNHHNFTRFLIISKQEAGPSGKDKTSVVFSFRDQVGILARMLEPFRTRSLNLMKIESRPIKKKAWEYVFFLDIEGHVHTPALAEAMEELREMCKFLRYLGSYPRAR